MAGRQPAEKREKKKKKENGAKRHQGAPKKNKIGTPVYLADGH
jgi:hypothetical protein